MSKEAMRSGLVALKTLLSRDPCVHANTAIQMIDAMLAEQPAQQEPVVLPCCGYTDASAVKWNPYNQVVQCHNCGQVYTTPQAQPAREPLTDEEIFTLFNKTLNGKPLDVNSITNFARAIEAAHGITKGNT